MTNTYKTVTLTVLICAAVLMTLFIYRSQQPHIKAYASENATMFPQGREIKAFSLTTATDQKFSQKDFVGHYTLLFFGFTNCSNVCPATLDMLRRTYDKLKAIQPDLQVVFISLDPARDTPEKLAAYTQHFHPNFIAVTGNINDLRKLQAELRIFSEKDPSTTDENYQIQHTSSILLINPQGKWIGLFDYGMKPEQFIHEFMMAMNTVNRA